MMKKIIFIFLILNFNNLLAWTITNSARTGFKTTTNIDVYIGSDSCTNAGLTANDIKSYTEEAVSSFWNTVSTSSLKFNVKYVTSTSLSSDDLNSAITKTPKNTIIIGCNANSSLFTSTNILAVGGMSCSGTDCRGAVIVNSIAGTVVASSDHQTLVATMAHELGHAVGLGHTSVNYALMYYDATGVVNKALSQDDIDGITYLYPNDKKLGGFAGSCSVVAANKNHFFDFLASFLIGFIVFFRPKISRHKGPNTTEF